VSSPVERSVQTFSSLSGPTSTSGTTSHPILSPGKEDLAEGAEKDHAGGAAFGEQRRRGVSPVVELGVEVVLDDR
jgi:hypothetical protein